MSGRMRVECFGGAREGSWSVGDAASRGGDTPVEGLDSVVAVRWTSRVEGRERVRSPRVVDSSGG